MDLYNWNHVLSYSKEESDEYYNLDLLNAFNIPLDSDSETVYHIFDKKVKDLYQIIKDNQQFLDFLNKYKDNYSFLDGQDNSEYLAVFFEFFLFDKTHQLLQSIFGGLSEPSIK